MKNKYGIGILILFFLLIYLMSDYVYSERDKQSQIVQTDEEVKNNDSFDEESFYLYEVNGYVVVFLNDRKTPYEYTNIIYDDLPKILKTEIRNGKYIENKEELYGFLENYTS